MTHPLRCETCKKDCIIQVFDAETKCLITFYPRDAIESDSWFNQGINQVGCASHSDAQYNPELTTCQFCGSHKNELEVRKDEREKVLDELLDWRREYMKKKRGFAEFLGTETRFIEELRKGER